MDLMRTLAEAVSLVVSPPYWVLLARLGAVVNHCRVLLGLLERVTLLEEGSLDCVVLCWHSLLLLVAPPELVHPLWVAQSEASSLGVLPQLQATAWVGNTVRGSF